MKVCGSIKEQTRAFYVNEVDIHLAIIRKPADFLEFDLDNQVVKFKPNHKIPNYFIAYKTEKDHFNAQKFFLDYIKAVYKIVSELTLPSHFTMDPISTQHSPCVTCMSSAWGEIQATRCRHEPDCAPHQNNDDESCGCKIYTRPAVSVSKIGIVLHLQWRTIQGELFPIDVDVNVPTLATSTNYNGSIKEIERYLETRKPVKWREELSKLQNMSALSARLGVTSSVRMRKLNRSDVMARQVR